MNEIWCPLKDLRKEKFWYSIVVRDRHGKVVSRERRKSRSFLKAWNQLMHVRMRQITISINDTGNNPQNVDDDEVTDFAMNAGASVTTYGIRVGTGNTPVAIDDHALETPIIEGGGGGQMEHLICTVGLPIVAAPSCSFIVSRTIANNSGGVITVREATIYIRMGSFYGCGVRDVLTVPQAVPDGGSITIDWTIQVTV